MNPSRSNSFSRWDILGIISLFLGIIGSGLACLVYTEPTALGFEGATALGLAMTGAAIAYLHMAHLPDLPETRGTTEQDQNHIVIDIDAILQNRSSSSSC